MVYSPDKNGRVTGKFIIFKIFFVYSPAIFSPVSNSQFRDMFIFKIYGSSRLIVPLLIRKR